MSKIRNEKTEWCSACRWCEASKAKGRGIIMKPAKVTYALGIAIVAAMAMFGSWLLAQDKADPNAAPNPYRMLESWAQLPEGRQWGAPIGVEVDHSDGKSIWVFNRCGENSS